MIYLTKEELEVLISDKVADFTKGVYLQIPSSKHEQPIIIYESLKYGHTRHFLGNELKDSMEAGMHQYSPTL